MEVRYVKENESGQVGRLYCESWKSAYKGIVPVDYLNSLTVENCTRPKTDLAKNLVLLDNEVCVGLCSICSGRDYNMRNYGEICAIYLLPDYFGKGFARPLFGRGIKNCATWDFPANICGCLLIIHVRENSMKRMVFVITAKPTALRLPASLCKKSSTYVADYQI